VAGDIAQDGLRHDHALRAAEAAECRVALRVRPAAIGGDLDVAQAFIERTRNEVLLIKYLDVEEGK